MPNCLPYHPPTLILANLKQKTSLLPPKILKLSTASGGHCYFRPCFVALYACKEYFSISSRRKKNNSQFGRTFSLNQIQIRLEAFGLATFFQFKSETVFRLKIHKDPKSHTFPLFGALKTTLLFKLGPKLQFCQTAKFKNG